MAKVFPPTTAVNSVGEPPKSSSRFSIEAGTVQMPCFTSDEERRTIDTESPWLGLFGLPLPVVTKTDPVELTAGALQTLPPVEPLGTVKYVATGAPVAWLNAFTPPRTSGLSHWEETPM